MRVLCRHDGHQALAHGKSLLRKASKSPLFWRTCDQTQAPRKERGERKEKRANREEEEKRRERKGRGTGGGRKESESACSTHNMHVGLQNCMSRAIKCMFETHNACSITNAGASAPLVQFTSPGTPGHTISRALNTSKCVSVHPWLSSV